MRGGIVYILFHYVLLCTSYFSGARHFVACIDCGYHNCYISCNMSIKAMSLNNRCYIGGYNYTGAIYKTLPPSLDSGGGLIFLFIMWMLFVTGNSVVFASF